MLPKSLLHPVPLCQPQKLETLVEHRTTYEFETCALHLFETRKAAQNVELVLENFTLTSMVRGKKVMRLGNGKGFDYLPGETVLVAPGQAMHIDFPQASAATPTQCLALEISSEFLVQTFHTLNERFSREEVGDSWTIDSRLFHLLNSKALSDTLERLLQLSLSEEAQAKDMLVDLTLQELMIRLMQSQSREFLKQNYQHLTTSNPFARITEFIREHLEEDLSPELLAEKACMSRTHFYRKFKEILGLSPSQYIMQMRLEESRKLLQRKEMTVTQVCFACGFENPSHFSRLFKQVYGLSPKAYQQKLQPLV